MTNPSISKLQRPAETSMQPFWKIVKRMPVLLAIAMTVLLVAPMPFLAQTTTSTILGSVSDPGGAVIPGATVRVINETTGDSRSTITSETGAFIFPSLLPATYTLRVELPGFQTLQRTGNSLTPNSRLDVGQLKLALGALTQTVSVEANLAQVETASAENSALISREQFNMIPSKGRDLTNMLRMLPGVQMTADQDALGGATGFGATIGAVQGTRSAQQNLTVDGLLANDMGAPAGLSGQVNMDAVQEVKVLLSSQSAVKPPATSSPRIDCRGHSEEGRRSWAADRWS
jgi:Carboxypeptidase regulatory-like domain/TonB-dependent Receptor Plug Domain